MPASYPSRYIRPDTFQDPSDRTLQDDPNLDRFRFKPREDNLKATARSGQRLWHIAHAFYGDAFDDAGSLSWILAYYNELPDQTLSLTVGQEIIGPSPQVLREEILAVED